MSNPEIVYQDNKCLVSLGYLVKIGIDRTHIQNEITDNLKGLTKNWKCSEFGTGSDIYIEYTSLPDSASKLIPIPESIESSIQEAAAILDAESVLELIEARDEEFQNYISKYSEIEDKEKRLEYASKHSILDKCSDICFKRKRKRGTLKKLFEVLNILHCNPYGNLPYFRRVLNLIITEEEDIYDLVHHKTNGQTNQSATKFDEFHKNKLIVEMSAGSLKNVILKNINREALILGKKEISYTTLLRHITPEIENITAEPRYGYNHFKANQEPYILKEKPKYKYQVVEADGSRLQIPYLNEQNAIKFLKIYVVIDVYSSKILGFSLNEEENSQMTIDAFFMAFEQCRYVPAHIVTDLALSKSGDLIKFRDDTTLLFNTRWRTHFPEYPNAKGTVENFFRNFHIQIARKYFDYVGLSINARSDDHRLKKNTIKKLLENREQLKNRSDLIRFASSLIDQWNSQINKEMSPIQKDSIGKVKDAYAIANYEIARVCWKHAKRKIKRSKITILNGEYEIEKNENRASLNGVWVDVYYHKKANTFIYVFNGNKFIECANRKPRFKENAQSKFKKIKSNKKYRSYCKDRVKKSRLELKKIRSDDPVIGTIYEKSKENSNSTSEAFINKYYSPGEGEENQFIEAEYEHGVPTF